MRLVSLISLIVSGQLRQCCQSIIWTYLWQCATKHFEASALCCVRSIVAFTVPYIAGILTLNVYIHVDLSLFFLLSCSTSVHTGSGCRVASTWAACLCIALKHPLFLALLPVCCFPSPSAVMLPIRVCVCFAVAGWLAGRQMSDNILTFSPAVCLWLKHSPHSHKHTLRRVHTHTPVLVPSPNGPNWPSMLSTALLFSTSDKKKKTTRCVC